MTELRIVSDNIVARDVTFEEYMTNYAQEHTEWVEGKVIKLSPVTREHDSLSGFWYRLLIEYAEVTAEIIVLREPFVMKVSPGLPGREPDIQVVLISRGHVVKRTMTVGPADIALEIFSEDSITRDTEEKFAEYEAGGVREYWIINPLDQQTRFYHLDENGKYQLIPLQDGVFQSRVLPRFRFNTRLLWQDSLPTGKQIVEMVASMVRSE